MYENDLSAVRVGDKADVRLSAYPDKTFTGIVSNIGPILDPNIRTAKVRIEVRNPGLFRPGMFATATFHGQKKVKLAAVPANAVLHLHDHDWVYVPIGGNRFSAYRSKGRRHASRRHAGDPLRGGSWPTSYSECPGLPKYGGTVVINSIVDFALNNRFIVLSVAVVLFVWGIIAFKRLPVEAYPDVANTWVQVITQWPGRAAEEVEQQITIPIEIQMNGVPHLQHIRSASLAGLSVVNLIFDDNSDNDWDRQKVLERLSAVTLPPNVAAQIGPDFSPIGSVYWYTLKSTNPKYDLMELKSLQDWTINKYIKAAPDVVDDSSFGGLTREYQVRVDPDKLVSYGLSLAQIEQQLTNSNANAGGSFIEQGAQQINVRAVGLVRNVQDIEEAVLKTQKGTPIRIKDVAVVTQGPKIRLGQIGKAIHRTDGVVVDDNDVVEGIVFMRKGADTASTMDGIHAAVQKLNDHILPPGVKIVPYLDRDDLVHYTTHTVLHNLGEGMILVVIILFIFLGNAPRCTHRLIYDTVLLVVCFHLSRPTAHLRKLAFLRCSRFRHGCGWRGGNGRKHRPSSKSSRETEPHTDGPYSGSCSRSPAARLLRDRHYHHGVSADLHPPER